MAVSVQHVTKIFGTQRAVDQVSFTLQPGEIVGFLGPNGAGKSTTMKILTGYWSPSSGEAWVNGLSVSRDPRKVKQLIGYLPEHNPLYLDLYVREYLALSGSFHGLRGRNLQSRVDDMIGRCGLEREQSKKIESLSKGYRQRVGLAQALLHDPQVLILDEPTSGLDPNQILEIRRLIKEVSVNKTVLFSSHILQEVQALCERVLVINQGKLVADGNWRQLISEHAPAQTVVVDFQQPVKISISLPGIDRVEELTPTSFRIVPLAGVDLRADLFRWAADHQFTIVGLRMEENNLENLFQQLTHAAT
ncbi:MAG: gliding motility-associated ABC transporter ATP-binding subunit GldA [Cyclobacteriaceae bacterium]|jgi:ABC-2 type transport system ATP-binding protein